MIPDTTATLLALLGLVAPGLVFQLRRERRRPQSTDTTFREASRVALTSLIFTILSLSITIPLAMAWAALPDVGQWLREPDAYLANNYASIGLFVLVELAIAIALALLAEALSAGDLRGQIVTGSVWYSVFRRDVPAGASRTWLWIVTHDGTQFKGPLRSYTPGESLEDREIALGGDPLLRRSADQNSEWEMLDKFDAVVIPASDIRHFAVSYLNVDGDILRATAPLYGIWDRFRARLAKLR